MNPAPAAEPLLRVDDLAVRFGKITVLEAVTFELQAGETLGLVGESGSGKSTLARAVLRLVPACAGRVRWCGEDLLSLDAASLRRRRRDLQIVFQDPLGSLNPRLRVGDILAEPLHVADPALNAGERQGRVDAMLERVGLEPGMARRYPHEFSGGQCQRIGIARAMMPNPRLLICDEPVSSLDVSIQGQIVNLLLDLQRERGMAMLFISHNLAVVRHLSHRVMVMHRGRIVETAPCDRLFAAPAHAYTRALLAAVPDLPRARGFDGWSRATGAPAATAPPADATVTPAEPTATPVGVTAAPVEAAGGPVDVTAAPVEAAVAPLDAAAIPVEAAATPVGVTAAPVESAGASLPATATPADATAPPGRVFLGP